MAAGLSPIVYDAAALHLPLTGLMRGQCRWPVNDAGPGQPHLFCGQPSGAGVYCRHHLLRAVGRGTESERSAHRALERERLPPLRHGSRETAEGGKRDRAGPAHSEGKGDRPSGLMARPAGAARAKGAEQPREVRS